LAAQRARCGGEGFEVPSADGAESHGGNLAGVTLSRFAQLTAVRRSLDHGADVPRTLMLRDAFGAEVDSEKGVIGADEQALAGQAPWDRVLIAVEANAEAGGDGVAVEIVGIERTRRERFERSALGVLEHQRGDLAGALVLAMIAEAIPPLRGLGIEVEEVGETPTRPEAVTHELYASFDAALALGIVGAAGDDGEAAASHRVGEKSRVKARLEPRPVLEHDGLHVVEDVGMSAAAEEDERSVHGAQEGAHGLAERELEVQVARVPEHGDERADTPWHPRQRESEIRPVDEKDLARLIVHGQVDLRIGAAAGGARDRARWSARPNNRARADARGSAATSVRARPSTTSEPFDGTNRATIAAAPFCKMDVDSTCRRYLRTVLRDRWSLFEMARMLRPSR